MAQSCAYRPGGSLVTTRAIRHRSYLFERLSNQWRCSRVRTWRILYSIIVRATYSQGRLEDVVDFFHLFRGEVQLSLNVVCEPPFVMYRFRLDRDCEQTHSDARDHAKHRRFILACPRYTRPSGQEGTSQTAEFGGSSGNGRSHRPHAPACVRSTTAGCA